MTDVDPITFEVIRHRLWAINDDQARTASSLSGTAIVHEGYDFNAGLTTASGDGLFVGAYVLHHATGIDDFVRKIVEQWGYDDIREGDVFFTNDPWWGALHANDAVLAMPNFAQGTLVSWSGIVMHEQDVGGSVPGSMVATAQDQFVEAPLLPGVKMGEGFALRKDIEGIWLRNSRTPTLNRLNLRARLGAMRRTHDRIVELVERYGLETVLTVQDQIVEHVERVVRARLAEIPDGEWFARGYHDHDGTHDTIYPVGLALTKTGDRVTFDFRDSAPQARGPINCARPALEGAVLGVVLMELCYDLPWSVAALRRVISIESTPGTVIDALPPAATSAASFMGTLTAQDTSVHAMGQMLLTSARHREEAQATWNPGMSGCTIVTPPTSFGEEPTLAFMANHFGGGGGARVHSDGVNTAGPFHSMKGRVPGIEVLEQRGKVLCTHRRELIDSGGPGRFRGGVGMEYGVMPYRTGVVSSHSTMASGVIVPAGRGLAGGLPGATASTRVLRATNIRSALAEGRLPTSASELTAERVDVEAPKQHTTVTEDDVIVGTIQGGAGYGDPLLRDPESVLQDVRSRYVSPEQADVAYGVVIVGDEVDREATEAVRARRREARRAVGSAPPRVDGDVLHPVADVVEVVDTGNRRTQRCSICRTELAADDESFVAGATTRELDWGVAVPGLGDRVSPEYVLREHACPGCGVALAADVQHRDDAPLASRLFPSKTLAPVQS
ncbi:hydantoinase B/oxoprolinase family protein [Microbacterium album]|uniref:Methylhydantoinase n=1 Tax=Microbacterium album TaxID=2053191 RepID=A0A917IBF8_9MICO|nr:hydantoinase B/oxoprolinase family protein [Microbacterium album]GGH33527.1 methylhydantoinase [Microbacterium album]